VCMCYNDNTVTVKARHMDYNGFKFICQIKEGIPGDILDACYPFVMQEMGWHKGTDRTRTAHNGLGFSELDDITDRAKSIKRIKININDSITDYDSQGRSMRKVRYRQLVRNPNKGLQRLVLKSYYLHYHNLHEEETPKNSFDEQWHNMYAGIELNVG
jgi:hypothetical protein